jgi:hypothetical protein
VLPPLVNVPAAAMAWVFWMVAEGVALVLVAVVGPESDVDAGTDILGLETCSLRLFLDANEPPTPPPTAAPISTIARISESQKVVFRRPQIRPRGLTGGS